MKKGFTIVELVIVIGVIAILSAILIPTFVNLSAKAEKSRALQEVSGAYSSYISEGLDGYYGDVDSAEFKALSAAEQEKLKIDAVALSQEEVVVLRKTEYFTYTSEKGWEGSADLPEKSGFELLSVVHDSESSLFNGCSVMYFAAL